MTRLLHELLNHPLADMVTGLVLLAMLAALAYLLMRHVIVRVVRSATLHSQWQWDDAIYNAGAFRMMARMAPPLVVQFGIGLVPDIAPAVIALVRDIAMAITVFYGLRFAGLSIDGLQSLSARNPDSRVPVKGYLQLLKIILYVVGFIVIVAIVIQRSPLMLLSGLGAASALLLLIFKDTLLGFVASVQIGSNDMLRLGDWIEMPSAGADGDVIDISLHTVKVRNWDGTITTIPTWRLITESFKNWRGMFDSGGRRIKRSLFINASSVNFLSADDVEALKKISLLHDYLEQKHAEVGEWNKALGEEGRVPGNQRRLTNIGTFRAYAQAYLEAHPDIHHGMTCMVRQLATEGDGIPLELYCFTSSTAWVKYESIQSDIFDHLFAILPTFGLGLYQRPAGADIRQGMMAAPRAGEAAR